MVLRSSLVVNKRIFNSIALSFLIFYIFLTTILIAIFIFLILLLICFLYIYYRVIFYLSLPFSSSPSSSLFLILLINVRIYAFYKGVYCYGTVTDLVRGSLRTWHMYIQGGNMNGSDAPPIIMERKISEPQVT